MRQVGRSTANSNKHLTRQSFEGSRTQRRILRSPLPHGRFAHNNSKAARVAVVPRRLRRLTDRSQAVAIVTSQHNNASVIAHLLVLDNPTIFRKEGTPTELISTWNSSSPEPEQRELSARQPSILQPTPLPDRPTPSTTANMSNTLVGNIYRSIMDEVIDRSRVDFEEGGVEEGVLEDLRKVSSSLPSPRARCLRCLRSAVLPFPQSFRLSCVVFTSEIA